MDRHNHTSILASVSGLGALRETAHKPGTTNDNALASGFLTHYESYLPHRSQQKSRSCLPSLKIQALVPSLQYEMKSHLPLKARPVIVPSGASTTDSQHSEAATTDRLTSTRAQDGIKTGRNLYDGTRGRVYDRHDPEYWWHVVMVLRIVSAAG